MTANKKYTYFNDLIIIYNNFAQAILKKTFSNNSSMKCINYSFTEVKGHALGHTSYANLNWLSLIRK